ncbi:MAG TPA: pantoate--beta-alanine ligase [Thermoleophilia bacterium]|nr:pantoate--beta-alanine ligase [Thermoleophilia bacterium]
MIVAQTVAEAREALRELPRPLGLVPTMGALHAGHLSLVDAALARCASVAASVFVNPTQFGRGEDFDRYPRDEARDLRLLQEAGVAVVFAPEPDEMYPDGFATLVHVGGRLTESFEGAARPSHFDGVAVIVAKLLGVVRPDVLFLGEKDAQQLAVVRRLVRDLDLPVEVAGVPTLREPDGLAMSSRNVYLTPDERAVAPDLYRALLAGAAAAGAPGAAAKDVVMAATAALLLPAGRLDPDEVDDALSRPRFELDYLAVVDEQTFVPEGDLGPRSRLVVAARLGSTRLIDTIAVAVPAAARSTTASPGAVSPVSAYPAKDATA